MRSQVQSPGIRDKREQDGTAQVGNRRLPLTVSRAELLVAGSDQEFRGFIHAMLALAARVERIRARFGKLIGISGIQYTILISILRLQALHDVSVRILADHLHLSGAFVTIETNKLLGLGLIEKAPDQNDQRRVRLRVTAKGRRLLGRLAPTQRKANDVLFEVLTADQFAFLCSLLPRLVKSADRSLRLLDSDAEEGMLPAGSGIWPPARP